MTNTPATSSTTEEIDRLKNLLQIAQKALSTCSVSYHEYNQFEGSWDADFSEPLVFDALVSINQELGIPAPASLRKP